MYDLNDTIVAISSPPFGARAIVRISGPDTTRICKHIFSPAVASTVNPFDFAQDRRPSSLAPCLIAGSITVDNELEIDAHLYLSLAPHSYTGDDVAEIHLNTNQSVTEALMDRLLNSSLRMAGPGEFTARAYLNGKIDLAQAEAVNEIVISSNTYQLAAAEKLLSGRLGDTTKKACSEIMDCLSLIEAGLDFSGEDIEFITRQQAVERLIAIMEQLRKLLSASSYESIIDLPAVGIAGAPNAGKSSLLNKLLGQERSIISDQRKTTRDVLTGELSLAHCRCVLFDCAGLTQKSEDRRQKTEVLSSDLRPLSSVLDELAQQAATEALRNSSLVIFCIDISKDSGLKNQDSSLPRAKPRGPKTQDFGLWNEEIGLWSLVCGLGSAAAIPVATKADLLSENLLVNRLGRVNELLGAELLPISVKSGVGLEQLQETIDRKIIELATGVTEKHTSPVRNSRTGERIEKKKKFSNGARYEIRDTKYEIVLTARHRQAVNETIEHISEAITTLTCGEWKPHTSVCGGVRLGPNPPWEITAMMLRAAYQALSDIKQQHIDEKILERIFSRFCIGK